MADKHNTMKPWQKRTLVTIFILLTFFTALWNLIPFATKWFINQTIEPFNSTFQADKINPNIFPIGLNLSDISIIQQSKERLRLGNASVGLDFLPLFRGEFHINHLTLSDFHTEVSETQTETYIAGIPLPQNNQAQPSSTSAETKDSSTPSSTETVPSVFLKSATLQNVSVDYKTSEGSDTFYISSAEITQAYHQDKNWAGNLTVAAGVNNAKVEVLGSVSSKESSLNADINLRSLALNTKDIEHFLPANLTSNLSSKISLEGQTNIKYHFGDDPTLELNAPNLQMKSGETRLVQGDQKVAWSNLTTHISDLSIKQLSASSVAASMAAKVMSNDLSVSSAKQQISAETFAFDTSIAVDMSDSSVETKNTKGSFSLSNLTGQLNGNSFSSASLNSTLEGINATFDTQTLQGKIQANLNTDAQTLAAQTAENDKASLSNMTLDAPLILEISETGNSILSEALTLSLDNAAVQARQADASLVSLGLQLRNSKLSLLAGKTDFSANVSLSSEQLKADIADTDSNGQQSFSLQSLSLNSDLTGKASQQSVSVESQKTAFTLKAPSYTSPENSASLERFNWSAENLVADISGDDLSISTKSKLELNGLNASASNLPNNQPKTTVAWQSFQSNNTLDIKQSPNKTDISTTDNSLKLEAVHVDQQDTLTTSLKQLDFDNTGITLSLNNGAIGSLNATDNNVTAESFNAELNDGSTLTAFNRFQLNSPALSQNSDGASGDIDLVKLNQFIASEPNTSEALPSLIKFDALDVNRVKLRPEGVEISSVVFEKLDAGLVLTSNQKIDNLVLPSTVNSTIDGRSNQQASNVSTAQENSEPLPQELEQAFYVVITKINISEGSTIDFTDRSIVPTLNRILTIEELSVDNLNTRDQGAQTHLLLKAKNGRYATIDSNVTIEPLAKKLTMDASAKVREVELPPISPYVSSALGYNIASGQLNMDLDMAAQQGELSGNSHIVLRQFDLGGKEQSSSVLKVGAVPLNLAINALKDGSDNIVLDLPLKGNVDAPQFQWQNFFMLPIRQGLYKASSVYLMQTFVPYANVISLAQLAGETVLKLRVQPLEFAFGQTQVDDSQEAYLNQLLALMNDRDDAEVRACGVAVAKDIDDSTSFDELSDAQRSQLYRIANERADSLKSYLVDNGIESGRVFICTPELESQSDAKPRVELNF
ncbi:hypothetical protein DN730_14135 [Marinomonas piezotolerans]|uniref:DUF748 domain-containing protein n=1 Tax=Marinomonas piezotolerans TaxID=2213058 RepID=A0A370U6T0_9GAMM|nr:DUF748 domain-containing protein [Marinomonas piezotolerans]RDL43471.1 hypothetical protein DN730_14135 [Marinomonas piezotolerans]